MADEQDLEELREYLIDRKFKREGDAPFASFERWRASRSKLDALFGKSGEELEYEVKLKKLSLTELIALLEEVKHQEAIDQAAMAELKDRQQFFHEPRAVADFAHWSKMPIWTPDEATALSLGKAPEVVNWETIKPHVLELPFADRYSKRRALLLRAAGAGELREIPPGTFVAWSERRGVDVPPELKNAVRAAQQGIEDWDSLRAERDDLKSKLANVERDKPPSTRERGTLYKMIIGMAKRKYRYDPNAGKQHAARSIMADLEQCGLSVTHDTILKYLREAAAELPGTST